MKSAVALLVLCVSGVITSQGCGSSDSKRKAPVGAPGGAAGADADGPDSGGEGGAVAMMPNVGGSAGEEMAGGNAGAPSQPSGGEAGTAGAAGEAGAGAVDPSCELATTCTNDLSGLGAGDFSIAFTLATTATAGSGVLSQRTVCMRSKFWDVRMRANGNLSVELDDETNYLNLVVPSAVNDGAAHELRVCRKNGHVYALADGELLEDAPNVTAFDSLPALATGTTTCTTFDGTVTLTGAVTGVCIGAL